MTSVKAVIDVAENEVGYLEKATNSNLDDKTANAGSGNWTKYGRDLIKEIGSPYSNGAAWCDMFVDWIFIKTYGKETAKKLLGGWSAYTPTSAQYFKNMKQWYTSNPQIGDIIFFKNASRICHTGIVYNIDTSKVYTIEGNTSGSSQVISNGGCVCKKSYLLSNSSIAGYGRPKYDDNISQNVSSSAAQPNIFYAIDVSSYQGDINWKSVKSSGISNAILKVIRKDLNPDKKFEQNWNGCKSADVNVIGVYNYSYATTVTKAKSDAEKVLSILNGRKCSIWLDIEDDCQKGLGKTLVDIINAYANVVVSSGYDFGVYTGMSFYNSYLKPYASQIQCSNFWIARYYNGYNKMNVGVMPNEKYNPKTSICRDIYGWQYTSSGIVSGISGNVDLDIVYGDIKSSNTIPPSSTTSHNTESSIEMMGKINTSSSNLNIRKEPTTNSAKVGSYSKGTIVQLLAHTNTGWYKTDKGYISDDYVTAAVGKVYNCSKLNMRSTPQVVNNNKISVLSVGDKVMLLKKESNGWYKVKTMDSKIGYISGNYVMIL